MAPIHNKTSSSSSSSSHSVHKSSADSTPRPERDTWESFVPVTRRGRFFQDSFFENTRSSFDDAVREALRGWDDDSDFLKDRWNDTTTSPRLSNLSRYRQMRSRREDDDNLAVTVTSDNNVHKIVLDVHDFMGGDLKVKVIGDSELLVEGSRQKGQEGASSISNQKFSRRFTLPKEADIAAIDSVMSSDGILTITAPKVGRISGTCSQNNLSSSTNVKVQEERESCDCEKCTPRLCTRENSCQRNVERSHTSTSADNIRGRSDDSQCRSDSDANVNSYSQAEKKSSTSSEKSSHRLQDRIDVPIKAFFNSRPITRRGRFFDDSFFEDSRSDYRSAIQDVLSKWGERSSNTDDMTSYRNLRTRDLRDDNQAVKTIEDEFQHKFVVDVQDFMKEGEINVKAVDDTELVVEGHVEKQDGPSKSIKKFSRRFNLPNDVHLEAVSSVMSSDGVLTIIAPKKSAIKHMQERSTPVCSQNIENNSEIREQMSECNIQSSEIKDHNKMDAKTINTEYDDRNLRGTFTCSSGIDAESIKEDNSNMHSSVTSKSFKAETSEQMQSTSGPNISIHVDAAEEKETLSNANRNIQERSQEDMDSELADNREMFTEELYTNQTNTRGRSVDNLDTEQRRTMEKSLDGLDADMRSVRERSADSRDRRSASIRFDIDEVDERDEDGINFQDSSTNSEKRAHSILKTPDRYLNEKDERHSRERSCNKEEMADGGRGTPSRDCKKKVPYGLLNPEDKRNLPISVRGHFISDAFFEEFQENFKTAISDVLLKFNEKSSKTDDITAYRNLRLRDPKLENQAFHVQEDQGAHKVVLDVKDFLMGEIEASVYDERELVIEGRAERRTETSITTLTFLRRFPLPENADADAITVVMSSDGVLTVVTPYKGFSGLCAIKNILSTEDRPVFDRRNDFERRWDDADWEDSKNSEEFLNRSLDSRLRSHLRHSTDDLF